MILHDERGNALSTTSAAARDQFDAGLHLFLGADYGPVDAFSKAVEADPGWALGHVALARAQIMVNDMAAARASLGGAEAAREAATPREAAHVEALSLLMSGQAPRARALVGAHLAEYPRDALMAQLGTGIFGLIGTSGDVAREAELLAYTAALMLHYGEDWWMMSMHALALCEAGSTDASARLMHRSLALNPRNANAAHFRAHAMYEAGETTEGRAFLAGWVGAYDRRAVLHGHILWHQALWALQDGDEAAMWDAVNGGVQPGASHGLPMNVLTDTAAILCRAQIAGFTVEPERWTMLSDYAAQFFPETGHSFADLHAALAHAMAGNGAELDRIIDTAKGYAGDLLAPAARAWRAIARENWEVALDELTTVMATAVRFSGSRAQRDLLELAYVNVLLRLGKTGEARRALAIRRPVLAKAPPVRGLN